MHQKPRLACCQFATEEDLETEPELFDCSVCVVAMAQEDLWPENREAWRLFHQVGTRAAVELGLGPVMLQAALERCESGEEADRVCRRIAVIYDAVVPVKTHGP